MSQPYNKPALTFADQVALLQSRGMVIKDPALAESTLKRISYYRLSGYWLPFKLPTDKFVPGTTFEAALTLYEYDRRLRLIVMDAIERVEVLARTVITYELSHAFGPFGHCDPSNFVSPYDHAKWLTTHKEEVGRATERFIDHYKQKYTGFPQIPLWMATEVMSLGALSRMYKNLKPSDQTAIAKHWGLHRQIVESWLHTLTVIRNICAHHSQLWDRTLRVKPRVPSHAPEWRLIKTDRVYGVLCILRNLTMLHHNGEDWADEVRKHLTEMDATSAWHLKMGTPNDWAKSVFWKK